jgi:N-formylglutamate amidohydrolase
MDVIFSNLFRMGEEYRRSRVKSEVVFTSIFLLSISFAVAKVYGQEEFVTVKEGNVPILLTAPHAGRPDHLLPNVPARTGKDVETRWDMNTDMITKLTTEYLQTKYHMVPYVVMAEFSRKSIDANREVTKAYDIAVAQPTYDCYHTAIKNYVTQIKKKFGQGILLDIHGQGLKNNVIWRGTRHGYTVQDLVKTHGWEAITGKNGILGFLHGLGYSIHPDGTEESEVPYEGGYTVFTYGSQAGGIDAIQLEIGGDFRLRPPAYQKFSEDFASAIHQFYQTYLKK